MTKTITTVCLRGACLLAVALSFGIGFDAHAQEQKSAAEAAVRDEARVYTKCVMNYGNELIADGKTAGDATAAAWVHCSKEWERVLKLVNDGPAWSGTGETMLARYSIAMYYQGMSAGWLLRTWRLAEDLRAK